MTPTAAAPRWTVHPATQEHDEELLVLFAQVFGHEMPLAQWRWKYADAPVRGLILRRGGAAVGFWGGMPRQMASTAGVVSAVQNGDVMVLPGESVVGRQGAMRELCSAFLDRFVGPGRTYEDDQARVGKDDLGHPPMMADGYARRRTS